MIRFLLSILLVSSFWNFCFGQSRTQWIEGQVLLQLVDGTKIKDLMAKHRKFQFFRPSEISDHMNIWLVNFDHSKFKINNVLTEMVSDQNVIHAQKNLIITSRTTPNDSLFNQQWAYGQDNNIDIDADLAWNITTGGLTPQGDTIVVAILDQGIHKEHPDLTSNVWVNHHEIDGNNIDDDTNGYVDDYWGWNSQTNNGNSLPTSSSKTHGTKVAGVIGADGNNTFGVAGVNWNIKLMGLRGFGTNAQVIASYSYALKQRKLYNETNGAEGAFVVAINSSFGKNGGQPADAPLWCAMYDSLGKHGILSVAAGPNKNYNIDEVGDLPCACPSKFLITVTNTNHLDEKALNAGFGATHMDLGAPGTSIYSTTMISGLPNYGRYSGCSYSSPMVAGAVALVYSSPKISFTDLATDQPEYVAKKIRDQILYGVKKVNDLLRKTVTGGRLNLHNSVHEINVNIEDYDTPNSEFVVYPSPLDGDELKIKFEGKQTETIEFQIFNSNGQVLTQVEKPMLVGTNLCSISARNLHPGTYIIKLISVKKVLVRKFIR